MFNFVHSNDLPVVEYLMKISAGGCYFAGGACLAWYQHCQTKSDIDVYFNDEKYWQRTVQIIKNDSKFNPAMTHSTVNAATFNMSYNCQAWKVQLIRKNFYQKIEHVIDDFDISVCKIAFDGNRVVMGPTFARDVANRVLRFDKISPQSHKRLIKYMCYGYRPLDNTIENLVNSLDIDWEATGTDHYA